jgi:hypothetical protein
MSKLDDWKKRRETDRVLKKDTPWSLQRKKEELERQKEDLKMRNEIREQKREISRLEHPSSEKVRKGVGTAGKKIIGFIGDTIKEGEKVSRVTSRRMRRGKRGRQSSVRLQTGRTLASPTGVDMSLAGGIARTEIIEDNVMSKDFFGTSGDNRQLLNEDRDMEDLLGSSMKKKEQDYF